MNAELDIGLDIFFSEVWMVRRMTKETWFYLLVSDEYGVSRGDS